VVRRLRDAWCRFVPDEIVAFYSLDAEIVSPKGEMFGQVYRGHEGLRRYLSEFAAAFEAPSFEVEDLIDAGACVVEIGQVSARGRHSGAEARRRIASLYSLRAGLVFKHVIYLDRAEALAAAGLPPRPTRRPPSGPTETAHEGRTSSDAHDGPDRLPITTRRAGAGDAGRLVATVTEAFERYRAWAPPRLATSKPKCRGDGPARGGVVATGRLVLGCGVAKRTGRSCGPFTDNHRPA